MTWKTRCVVLLLGLATAALLVWALQPQPVVVEVAMVQRGRFQQSIEEDGKTRVRERYVVAAPLAGRVLRMGLKAGDTVQAGRPVAVIVPTAPALLDIRTEQELSARVAAATAERLRTQAMVERANATLAQARTDLERTRQLATRGFVSLDRLEQQQTDVRVKARELQAAQAADHVAAHQAEQAQAALLRLRHDPQHSAPEQRWEVYAPVSGQVLRVLQESETVVAMGTPLLEIAQPWDVEVVVDVLTADASHIHPGAPVHLDHGGQTPLLQGRVRLVEPAAFTKISALGVEEQRVNVIIDLISPHDQWPNLGDGHRVDARIVVWSTEDALQVPTSALFRRDSQWATFTMAAGHAQQRLLQLGPRSSSNAVVESGLEPGEQVIVYPADTVRDGVRVQVRVEQP